MTRTRWTWLALAIVYVLFFSWYTSFGGPLSADEIADYVDRMQTREPAPDPEAIALIRRFLEQDTGDDFVMINLIDLYEVPQQIEGVEPGSTSPEVLDQYMEYMYPALFARASHPVLFGQAANTAMDLMNAPGMHAWTTGAAMRYRSRRDMMDIVTNPAFSGSHEFKVAAMRKTIAFPADPWFHFGDPRLLLALLLLVVGFALSWLFSGARRP